VVKITKLGKIGLLQRAKNFMADEIFTTNPKTSINIPKTSIDMGFSGGAKYGKMIKANKGAMVMAKCKMGRNKATKIT
jgi:hypothetical protein